MNLPCSTITVLHDDTVHVFPLDVHTPQAHKTAFMVTAGFPRYIRYVKYQNYRHRNKHRHINIITISM